MTNITTKMWGLRIRIKRNDEIRGKRLQKLMLDLLMAARIDGATAWTGIDGFGKRGRATTYLEGVLINMPLIIEVTQDGSTKALRILRLNSIYWILKRHRCITEKAKFINILESNLI